MKSNDPSKIYTIEAIVTQLEQLANEYNQEFQAALKEENVTALRLPGRLRDIAVNLEDAGLLLKAAIKFAQERGER